MFLKVENLKKSYKTGEITTTVLKGVGMNLDKGEIGVILGPSGSGSQPFLILSDEVLKAVDMLDKKHRFPRELSGGEQQRVSIARAIVKNPKLLLCDEPTGALDFSTSREILKLLQKINKDFGTTILMITHNTAISALANKVYRVRSREIVESVMNNTTVPAERIEW